MVKKVLILENKKTLDEIIISGSYWFRIEMAYGFKRLGFKPFLIQHPSYKRFPWINGERFSNQDSSKNIVEILAEYDLIILLDDIPLKERISTNKTTIIYWDIEGFPHSNKFFEQINREINNQDYQYYGAKFNSAKSVLERYYYQLKKQKLQYWKVDAKFSAAKNPLIKDSEFIPLGAEPDLYKEKDLVKRDISLAIFGSTARWFQAKERLDIGAKMLEKLKYPITYWYGAMPEIESENMVKNCYPTGHVDFFSLPNFLMRTEKVIHVPRPYHLQSNCQSATIFQSAAAGAIPIHHFKGNLDANRIGYHYENIDDIESLKRKEFPDSFSYKARFVDMIVKLGEI